MVQGILQSVSARLEAAQIAPAYLTALLTGGLAVVILGHNHRRPVNRAWACLLAFIGLWQGGTGLAQLSHRDIVLRWSMFAGFLPLWQALLLQEALLEAALLAELGLDGGAAVTVPAEDETYRLLTGVLLRSPEDLQHLRSRTVAELESYDAVHDTELLETLRAFLAHHGSTTDTAEAMSLHRHTVGYRLARVHEVSGLSPYESDGRERLGLGLKAHHILDANRRLSG